MLRIQTSFFVLPEPPWKTRKIGFESDDPVFSWTLGSIRIDKDWTHGHLLVLVLGEQLGMELDVARRIHAMNISESCGD